MKLIRLNLDSWSKYFLLLGTLLAVLQGALLFWALPHLPPQVPLFYSLPWGESRLSAPIWLAVLPGLSAGLLLVNLLGSVLLKELVLTRVLSSTAFLVTILAAITLAKIILLGLP